LPRVANPFSKNIFPREKLRLLPQLNAEEVIRSRIELDEGRVAAEANRGARHNRPGG
jgi:hypothetical protein